MSRRKGAAVRVQNTREKEQKMKIEKKNKQKKHVIKKERHAYMNPDKSLSKKGGHGSSFANIVLYSDE